MKKWIWGMFFILLAASAVAYNKFALFVIQPIGALPEGKTLLVERESDMPFVDSADAMCKRRAGSVSLLCRGIALNHAATKMKIYARLPYSEWLYLKSTGGVKYER